MARDAEASEFAHVCRLLQAERRYRSGWCYFMLRSRWGIDALKKLGILA